MTSALTKQEKLAEKGELYVKSLKQKLLTCPRNEIFFVSESIQKNLLKAVNIRLSSWNVVLKRFEKILLDISKESMVTNTGFKIPSAIPTRKTTVEFKEIGVVSGIIRCIYKMFQRNRESYLLHRILHVLMPFIASEDSKLLLDLTRLYELSLKSFGYFRNLTAAHYQPFLNYLQHYSSCFSYTQKSIFLPEITEEDLVNGSEVCMNYTIVEEESDPKGGQDEKLKAKLTVGPLCKEGRNVCGNPYEVYVRTVQGKKLSLNQQAELWTKIKYACALNGPERLTYTRLSFRFMSLLTSIHHHNGSKTPQFLEIFRRRKKYIEEAMELINHPKVVGSLKREIFGLLSNLLHNRSKGAVMVSILIPPSEQGMEFHGFLITQLGRLVKWEGNVDEDEELKGLCSFLSRAVVHPTANKAIRESASLLTKFMELVKHSSGDIRILGTDYANLLCSASQTIRRLVNLGLVTEVVKNMGAVIANEIKFSKPLPAKRKKNIHKRKMEDEDDNNNNNNNNEEEDVILFLEDEEEEEKDEVREARILRGKKIKLLESSARLLVHVLKVNTTSVEIRELADLGFIKTVEVIIKEWQNHSSKLVAEVLDVVSTLMNKEPTSIPIWLQAGIYELLEGFVTKEEELNNIGGDMLSILPKMLYSFSLNQTCKEKIIKSKIFPKMVGWTVNKKMATKFRSYNVIQLFSRHLNLFLRSNPNQNGEVMTVVQECILSISNEIEKDYDELTSRDEEFRIDLANKKIVVKQKMMMKKKKKKSGEEDGKVEEEEEEEQEVLIRREMTEEEIQKIRGKKKKQKSFTQMIRTFTSFLSLLFKDNRPFAAEFLTRSGVKTCYKIITHFPIIITDPGKKVMANPMEHLFSQLYKHRPDEAMKQIVDSALEFAEDYENKTKDLDPFSLKDNVENRRYLYMSFTSISCFSRLFKMVRTIMIMRKWKDTKLQKYMETLANLERRVKWLAAGLTIESVKEDLEKEEVVFVTRIKKRKELEEKSRKEKLEKKKNSTKKKQKKPKKKKKKRRKKKETTTTTDTTGNITASAAAAAEDSKKKKKEPEIVLKDPAENTIFNELLKEYMGSLTTLYTSIQKTMFQLLMQQDRHQTFQIGMFFNEIMVNMIMRLIKSLKESALEKTTNNSGKIIEEEEEDEEEEDEKKEKVEVLMVKKKKESRFPENGKSFEGVMLTRECQFLKMLMDDIYVLFFSESHRNSNTYVLKSFVDIGGLDTLLQYGRTIYLDFFDHMKIESDEEKKERKKNWKKLRDIFPYERKLDSYLSSIRLNGVLSLTRFFQKMVNLNYIVQSPVTRSMLLTTPDFAPSKFLKLIQIQVANVVVDIWKNPKLLHYHSDWGKSNFVILLINIVSHIVRGTDDEEDGPGGRKKKKKFVIDNFAFSQLISMGFEEYKCRAALKKTNNDVTLATEFLLMNPDIKREDTEGDEELEAALAMSLSLNESVPTLRNDGMEWVLKILRISNTEKYSFPCADLLAVLLDQPEMEETKMEDEEEEEEEEEEERQQQQEEKKASREELFSELVTNMLAENVSFTSPSEKKYRHFVSILKTIHLLSQYRPSVMKWISTQGRHIKERREEIKEKKKKENTMVDEDEELEKKSEAENIMKDEDEQQQQQEQEEVVDDEKKMKDEDDGKEDKMKDEDEETVEPDYSSVVSIILEVLDWINRNEKNMVLWDHVLNLSFNILNSLTEPKLGTPPKGTDEKNKKWGKYGCKFGEFDVPDVSVFSTKYISEENRIRLMKISMKYLKRHVVGVTKTLHETLRSRFVENYVKTELARKMAKEEKEKKMKDEDEESDEELEEEGEDNDDDDDDEEEEEEEEPQQQQQGENEEVAVEEEEEEEEEYDDDEEEEEEEMYEESYGVSTYWKRLSSTGKNGREVLFPLSGETMNSFFSLLFNLTGDSSLSKIAIEKGIVDQLISLPSSFLTPKMVVQTQMIFQHLIEEDENNFRTKVESVILEKLECKTTQKKRKQPPQQQPPPQVAAELQRARRRQEEEILQIPGSEGLLAAQRGLNQQADIHRQRLQQQLEESAAVAGGGGGGGGGQPQLVAEEEEEEPSESSSGGGGGRRREISSSSALPGLGSSSSSSSTTTTTTTTTTGIPPEVMVFSKKKPSKKKTHTKLYVRILMDQLLLALEDYVTRKPEWVFRSILECCRIPPSQTPVVNSAGPSGKKRKSSSGVYVILKPDRHMNLTKPQVQGTKKDLFFKLLEMYRSHPCHLDFSSLGGAWEEKCEKEKIRVEEVLNVSGGAGGAGEGKDEKINEIMDYLVPIPQFPAIQKHHILHMVGQEIICHDDVQFLLGLKIPVVASKSTRIMEKEVVQLVSTTTTTTEEEEKKREVDPQATTQQEEEEATTFSSFMDTLIRNLHHKTPRTSRSDRASQTLDQGKGVPGSKVLQMNVYLEEDLDKKLKVLKPEYEKYKVLVEYHVYRMSMFILIKMAGFEPAIVFKRIGVFLKTYLGMNSDSPPIYGGDVEPEVIYGISEFFSMVMDTSMQRPELLKFLCQLMVEEGLVSLLGEVLRKTPLDHPIFPTMGNSILRLLERVTKQMGGVKKPSRKGKKHRWRGKFPLSFNLRKLLQDEMETSQRVLMSTTRLSNRNFDGLDDGLSPYYGGGGGGGLGGEIELSEDEIYGSYSRYQQLVADGQIPHGYARFLRQQQTRERLENQSAASSTSSESSDSDDDDSSSGDDEEEDNGDDNVVVEEEENQGRRRRRRRIGEDDDDDEEEEEEEDAILQGLIRSVTHSNRDVDDDDDDIDDGEEEEEGEEYENDEVYDF